MRFSCTRQQSTDGVFNEKAPTLFQSGCIMYWKNIHLDNDEPLQFDCHIYQEFSNSEASSIEHKQWYINIKKYDGKVKPHMKNKVFIFEAKTFDIDVDKEKIKRTLLVKKIHHMEYYNPQDEIIDLQHSSLSWYNNS